MRFESVTAVPLNVHILREFCAMLSGDWFPTFRRIEVSSKRRRASCQSTDQHKFTMNCELTRFCARNRTNCDSIEMFHATIAYHIDNFLR